jgi:hypothetical protein
MSAQWSRSLTIIRTTHLKGPYSPLANLAEYAIRVHLFASPSCINPILILLILPSIMSLGATQCAPALAYAIATSAILCDDAWASRVGMPE